MAGISQKTLNWLWDVLRREYRDPQRTYSDLVRVLTAYASFALRTDVYTFENGVSALLVHVQGTVPVTFRGTHYRFPIAIWVPQTYPYDPPILFVTPTTDMAIRPGQYVSGSDGRIYHPYLAQWKDAWERSTITDFVAILTEVFAREPPVIARQTVPEPRLQAPTRPPIPQQQQQPSDRLTSNLPARALAGAPQPPPKPSSNVNGAAEQIGPAQSPRQSRYNAPPPLPQDSTNYNRPQSMSLQTPGSATNLGSLQRNDSLRNSSMYAPSFTQGVGAQHHNPQPTPNTYIQQPPAQQLQDSRPQFHSQALAPQQAYQQPPPQAHFEGPSQRPMPQPELHQGQQHNYQQRLSHPNLQQQPSKPKPKPPPDLMDDSPFDVSLTTKPNPDLPTPAIPPNPEKAALLTTLSQTLGQHLQTQIAQTQSAVPALQSQHNALLGAQSTLQSELAHLQTLQSQLTANITALNTTLKSADGTIVSAKKQASENKIPTIDEIIIPPTTVARQLYDSVAEQRGYEAAILALTEGFVRGRIGSDVWGRKTRECAREEFRRKWLVKRIGHGMALE